MPSLALPSEARCKKLIQKLLTGSECCAQCHGSIAFKRTVTYGWCSVCRVKIRPKSLTWFRGSKLPYRQIFLLLHCWQARQSPGSARLATGLSYTTVRRWYWRFRSLVSQDDAMAMLSGVLEVDEAWFGKKRHVDSRLSS